jgi:hypothetical protein
MTFIRNNVSTLSNIQFITISLYLSICSNKRKGGVKRAMKKDIIELQLQSLRDKLYEVVEEKGSFTHPAVLAISEEADQLIVALQAMKQYGEHCTSIELDQTKSTV